MAFAVSAPRSAWRALLWKDFQQVKPALLVVTIALMGIQALSLLIAPWMPTSGTGGYWPLDMSIGIATVAPVVCVLASIGLLIGQERQTGSWSWSTGLPQSWRQALASKTLISLVACVLPLLPLSLIPLIAWSVGYSWMHDSAALPMAALAILLAIYMAVYLTIGVLIFREPLTGLVVGSIVCVIGPYLVLACIAVLLSLVGYTGTGMPWDWLVFGLLNATFAVASIAMVWLFRWRWSYGMTASLPRFGISVLESLPTAGSHDVSRGFYQRAPQGEFRMLLAHSVRSSWGWMLLCIGMGVLMAVSWFPRFPGPIIPPVLSYMLVAIAMFWGIASFAVDQTSHRFRFMADRGVSPGKMVTVKILPAVLAIVIFPLWCLLFLIFLMISVPVSSPAPGMVLLTLVAALTAYLVGALCALCFRSSVMAMAVSLLTIMCLFLLRVSVEDSFLFFYQDVNPNWFIQSVLWVTPVAIGLGFVALYWLAKKWLIQDSPRLERHYAWIFPSLALLPVLAPIMFGFLLLPNVAWQGGSRFVSVAQGSPDVWPELRELELFELPPGLDLPYGPQTRIDVRLVQDTSLLDHFVQTYLAQLQHAWQQAEGPEKFAAELELLGPVPNQTQPHIDLAANNQHKRRYYDRIYTTALVGDFLSEQGRIDLAKLAWASNKQLLETAMRLEPNTGELGAWIFSSLIMNHMLVNLDNEQRAQWGSDDEYRGNLGIMRQKTIEELRRLAALHQQELRLPVWGVGSEQGGTYPWIVRAVPTLRWRQERSLAIELDNAIAIVNGQSGKDASYGAFAEIIEYWKALQAAQRTGYYAPISADQARGMQGFGGLGGVSEEQEVPPEF